MTSPQRLALGVHEAQAGFGLDAPYACDRRAAGLRRLGHGRAQRRRGGEQQFVVVAPGQRTLPQKIKVKLALCAF